MVTASEERRRWLALAVLCLGELMIVLDGTIVNVALPSIREDLRFTESSLVWVVNAYMLTYGGFLLLGGRLGDLYGRRRLFLGGIVAFTAASVACGLADSQAMLVTARAVQGLGGAVVSAVALSLIMTLFPEPAARAKAMGFYGFVCASGGSIGVLAGGVLTTALGWHWVFLINVPVALAVVLPCLRLVAPAPGEAAEGVRLDVGGALTITLSLMLAVYAVVGGNEAGWGSARTLAMLALSLVLFIAFVAIETRVAQPLVPLALFRLRNLTVANVAGVFWAISMFAWFFVSALYMQLVLGWSALQVGLAYLPSNVVMALLSLGWSARLVLRFGTMPPLVAGLLLEAAGLAWFAPAPLAGTLAWDVMPGMLLLGVGAGIALNPILMAAMGDVKEADAGLASGIVNTAFMMGGALGLAALAAGAAARTTALQAGGVAGTEALAGGYRLAFSLGAGCAALAAVVCFFGLRAPPVGAPVRDQA